MKTNVTRETVLKAINNVNNERGYQLSLNRDDYSGNWYNFTLKTPSKVAGSMVSASGRNMPKASWHAHGYLFDEIIKLEPNAVIITYGTMEISKDGGNWTDYNSGGVMASTRSIL